jgi:hypothetical protein
MNANANPNLLLDLDLNRALVRLKAGSGTPDDLRKDFERFRDAVVELEETATRDSLLNLGEYGNVMRGFARGYRNLRTMIDDADDRIVPPPPPEEPPA